MLLIKHRINTLEKQIKDGAEIDLRCFNYQIYLTHDPLSIDMIQKQPLLEDFLKKTDPQTFLVMNLKEEGIENQCIDLLLSHGFKNWFFLDMSQPYFTRYAYKLGENFTHLDPSHLAVRYSHLEPKEYALSFAGKVGWIWVDFFFKNQYPLNEDLVFLFKKNGFKLCLVSPELQGFSLEITKKYVTYCTSFDIDAVVTKNTDLWL